MTNPFLPENALSRIPDTMVQNAFVHWRDANNVSSDYAAYRYEYRFRRDGDKSGTEKTVTVDAEGYSSVSPDWPAGQYRWTLYAISQTNSDRAVLGNGRTVVQPDPSTAVDGRTHAEIMLAKIESLLEGRADSDVESYTIAGRQITKMKASELTAWRDHYRQEVLNERGGGAGYMRVRF